MVNQWLSKILTPVEETPGQSGYFSSPSTTLDPRLFGDSDHLRAEVKDWILTILYRYWSTKFHKAQQWSQVWLAGSGISYQWSAARGNGDLDVLIGVDFPEFFRYNDKYLGFSERDVADMMNQDMHLNLWPLTAMTEIGSEGRPHSGGTSDIFEVTFYVNPNSADICDIHPYAAYNVSKDEWTVRPPELSQEPTQAFPTEFWSAAHTEKAFIHSLVNRYNSTLSQLKGQQPSSPGWSNFTQQIELLSSQAKTLFDDIHLGRKNAFGPGGSGYGDWYNFRWQYHKKSGTVQALDAIAHLRGEADEKSQTVLYGTPLKTANEVLREAVWSQNP